MLRVRLAAHLLFNVLLAGWVYYDARTRGARKPLFAAGLTLLWGPLGLGFWASDRPLAGGERRAGGAGWIMARTFAIAWAVLLPTILVLVVPDIRDRAAVPGSLGAQFGVALASLLVSLTVWLPPLVIALVIGGFVRVRGPAEAGRPQVAVARPLLIQAILIAGLVVFVAAKAFAAGPATAERVRWQHVSSSRGDLPVPGTSAQQTGALVADLDGDGINDFALSFRQVAPALVWYQRVPNGWMRHVLEPDFLTVEAGGAAYDIDGDRDLDLVFGGDWQSSDVWWWENPGKPISSQSRWPRHLVKHGGATQHHDQVFGDFLQTGRAQLAFWNQNAKAILLAAIPPDPRHAASWNALEIFEGAAGEPGGVYPEGMDVADIDGDGHVDLLAGNAWFTRESGTAFRAIRIAPIGGRIAAGQLVEGGPPEIVIAPGDGTGPLRWYSCEGRPDDPASWHGHDLVQGDVVHGHSLALGDIDGDGHLDIFAAEMAKWKEAATMPDNPDARAWIFYGDGRGHFETADFARGMGFHETRLADLDGDGRLDVLQKPYNWNAPRVDVWLNRKPSR
jgi:hypothetical protein